MKFPAPNRIFSSSALVLLIAIASACSDSSSDAPTDAALATEVEFIDLRAVDITTSRAMVFFTTSLPTSCEVEFGLAQDNLDQVAEDPSMGEETYSVDHAVPLENLEPNTLYYYRARGTTEVGRTFWSTVQQFTTPAAAVEEVPLINLAALSNGASVLAVSSNFGGAANNQTWGADKAFDGDMNSEWATNGDGDNASLTIGFDGEKAISRFGFRSRRMADGSSIITSVELVFESSAGNQTLGPFDTPDPDELYTFDLDEPVVATQVTLVAVTTTGGNTGAKEIQFFGPEE